MITIQTMSVQVSIFVTGTECTYIYVVKFFNGSQKVFQNPCTVTSTSISKHRAFPQLPRIWKSKCFSYKSSGNIINSFSWAWKKIKLIDAILVNECHFFIPCLFNCFLLLRQWISKVRSYFYITKIEKRLSCHIFNLGKKSGYIKKKNSLLSGYFISIERINFSKMDFNPDNIDLLHVTFSCSRHGDLKKMLQFSFQTFFFEQ